MAKTSRRERERHLEDAVRAMSAGVALTVRDWKRMTPAEKAAWLAVREQALGMSPLAQEDVERLVEKFNRQFDG